MMGASQPILNNIDIILTFVYTDYRVGSQVRTDSISAWKADAPPIMRYPHYFFLDNVNLYDNYCREQWTRTTLKLMSKLLSRQFLYLIGLLSILDLILLPFYFRSSTCLPQVNPVCHNITCSRVYSFYVYTGSFIHI